MFTVHCRFNTHQIHVLTFSMFYNIRPSLTQCCPKKGQLVKTSLKGFSTLDSLRDFLRKLFPGSQPTVLQSWYQRPASLKCFGWEEVGMWFETHSVNVSKSWRDDCAADAFTSSLCLWFYLKTNLIRKLHRMGTQWGLHSRPWRSLTKLSTISPPETNRAHLLQTETLVCPRRSWGEGGPRAKVGSHHWTRRHITYRDL